MFTAESRRNDTVADVSNLVYLIHTYEGQRVLVAIDRKDQRVEFSVPTTDEGTELVTRKVSRADNVQLVTKPAKVIGFSVKFDDPRPLDHFLGEDGLLTVLARAAVL